MRCHMYCIAQWRHMSPHPVWKNLWASCSHPFAAVMIEFHWFDLLWICWTACSCQCVAPNSQYLPHVQMLWTRCPPNPQEIEQIEFEHNQASARASSIRRFTDVKVYGTGFVKIWKTRHEISVDIRIFSKVYRYRYKNREGNRRLWKRCGLPFITQVYSAVGSGSVRRRWAPHPGVEFASLSK